MKKRARPSESPPNEDIQPRETGMVGETALAERRRKKAVDRDLARQQPNDEWVDGLTGKYIA